MMDFFDIKFSAGDIAVIIGFVLQFFRYVRRLESVERKINKLEQQIQDHWGHIESISETISEWAEIIPSMKDTLNQVNTTVQHLSDREIG